MLNVTPNDGFAKVHYGFILKAQNKISESIPYLKVAAMVSFPYTLFPESSEVPFGCGFQLWRLTDWHDSLSLPSLRVHVSQAVHTPD